jgi:hypothetical protein
MPEYTAYIYEEPCVTHIEADSKEDAKAELYNMYPWAWDIKMYDEEEAEER